MEANELRIGNLVADTGGKTLRIDYFEGDKICQKMEVNGTVVHPLTEYIDSLEPISLDEKWLKDFGFNERVGDFDKNISRLLKIGLGKNGERFYYGFGSMFRGYSYYSNMIGYIDYVNQLQNLYFALTGKELARK